MALNEATGKKHSASRSTTSSNRNSSSQTTQAKRKPVSNSASGSIKHKVVSGDNLVTLAKRYGLSSNDIAAANNLKNKNSIKPGQVLVIPSKNSNAKVSTQTASNKRKPAATTSSKPKPKPKTQAQAKPKT
jgi:LysM repeat protein